MKNSWQSHVICNAWSKWWNVYICSKTDKICMPFKTNRLKDNQNMKVVTVKALISICCWISVLMHRNFTICGRWYYNQFIINQYKTDVFVSYLMLSKNVCYNTTASVVSWWLVALTAVDREFEPILDQHAYLDFYSIRSLKQQSTDRYVAPLTLTWFGANQSLLFLLIAAFLAEKQQIPILYSFVWQDREWNET
jgi:hypothetical protein